jgi:hypothetical protein
MKNLQEGTPKGAAIVPAAAQIKLVEQVEVKGWCD